MCHQQKNKIESNGAPFGVVRGAYVTEQPLETIAYRNREKEIRMKIEDPFFAFTALIWIRFHLSVALNFLSAQCVNVSIE